MTRRRALTVAGQAVGGSPGRSSSCPRSASRSRPIFEKPEERWESVGPTSRFTADTYKPVVFTLVRGDRRGGQDDRLRPPGIRRSTAREPYSYVAISTRCAHLGCPVNFVAAAGNFICPCHGGVYDFQGKVIGGPPVRPLDRFQTRVVNGQVQLGPRYSVTSQLDPVRTATPASSRAGSGTTSIRRGPTRRRRREEARDEDPRRAHPAAAEEAAEAGHRPERANGGAPPARAQGGAGRPRRVARRAHRRRELPHRDALPEGPEGDQLVLHARLGDAVRVRGRRR